MIETYVWAFWKDQKIAFQWKILEKILDENLWALSPYEKYFGVFLTPKFQTFYKYCGMTSLKIILYKNKNIVKNYIS